MFNSDKIPDVTYRPDIQDIFYWFGINWDTLSSAVYLLLGTLFGFFFLGVLIRKYYD